MALIKDLIAGAIGVLPGSYGIEQAIKNAPSTGLLYQAGNKINSATGGQYSNIVNNLFGTSQPSKVNAQENQEWPSGNQNGPFLTDVVKNTAGNTGNTKTNVSAPDSSVDLSNPVKKDDYARSLGFDNWNQYQDYLNQNNPSNREAQVRNEINTGYDEYVKKLGGLETSFNKSQEEDLTSASKVYEQIFGGLEDQKKTNMEKLDANRGQVKERETSSIKELQDNLSNVVRGMSMQLGAMGGGDTSASKVMMPYAYTKIAGQQEGSIRNQSNQQLFEIDQQEKDTELQFTEMWRDTEIQKEQQLKSVKEYYGNAIRNVQLAIANAPLDKAKDLASLSQSLLSEATANLRTLETETRQRQTDIANWATGRMSELNNLKLQLSGSANFNPRDIVFNELQMLNSSQPTSQASSSEFYNPLATAKKIREDYFA